MIQLNIPKEWLYCKISDFAHIVMGQSPPSSSYNNKKVGLPFYQGKAEFGCIYPETIKWCDAPKKIAEKGSVLLSVRAPVGPTNINQYKSCIGRGLAAIYPLGEMKDKFILYLFRNYEPLLSEQGKGTTFKAITKDFLFNLNFALPPLSEQRKILEKLDELFSDLDNAITNLKKAKEQLKSYRQAVLKYAFEGALIQRKSEWRYLPLNRMCKLNPSKKEIKGLIDDNTKVSFLPMTCISEAGLILQHEIRKFGDVKKNYSYFRNNDVLLAKITPCFENGKKAIAENLINGIGFGSTEFHVLRANEEICTKWILLAISQENFRNEAIMQMAGAVGQKRVPQRVIENFKIPIPSKEEQVRIIREVEIYFSVADKLEETIESSLKQAESLRQSILQQAFEGNLTADWRKKNKNLISGENSAEALLKKIKKEKQVFQTKKGKRKND